MDVPFESGLISCMYWGSLESQNVCNKSLSLHTYKLPNTHTGAGEMRVYWNDLQTAVQQRLSVNGKSKNLVVAQSHEAGCLRWSSVCAGVMNRQAPVPVKEWMCGQCKGRRRTDPPLFHWPYLGFQAEGVAQNKAVFPPQDLN